MTDFPEFKRMSFFTGFFTTAQDWNDGQNYHLEKRRLHNRGLHTPGVIDGLKVVAAGGLSVRVEAGAALDGDGREMSLPEYETLEIEPPDVLPQWVYVTMRYGEQPTDYAENVESKQYSGYTRVTESPVLEVTTEAPDNQAVLELARIEVRRPSTPGAQIVITDAVDADNPKSNQIDLRFRERAGARVVLKPLPPPEELTDIIGDMQDGRRDFAALAGRFPVPSATTMCAAALTVELLARMETLRLERVPSMLEAIAAVEQDVGSEIGTAYPAVATIPEFQAYESAVNALQVALQQGRERDELLEAQERVSEAARVLSTLVLVPPIADSGVAGSSVTVTTEGDRATVTLDASGSTVYGDRDIVGYRWDKRL